MCGVAGEFNPGAAPSAAVVDAMLDLIAHRGPDGRGVVSDGPAVLGHVRLSILDLSDRGAQPMWSRDGRFLITYNGEVYNFADLRSRLFASGGAIESTGDTQVLLEHLVRFGIDDTLARIEGFFAFALWDARDQVLTLARDRLGKKPLYWNCVGGAVRFASEMKALVDGNTRPDLTTLDAMLLGFSATWGRATPFEGIECVEAGSIVQFRGSSIPSRRRWFTFEELVDPYLHAELDVAGEVDVLRRITDAFDQSLAFRMVSDVPVASLVSGGVDSSLVTVLASATEHPPELYHADVVADSERPAAESVAASVGRRLHVARVTDESLLSQVTRATWFNDAPLTYHVNAVPFLSVCERAGNDGVKVLLSGEGSDEFFLGYPQYGLAPYLDAIAAGKQQVRELARRAVPRVVDQVWPSAAESKNVMLRELVSRAEVPLLDRSSEGSVDHLSTRSERRAHRATLSLARSHLSSLLHRNDRLGMAAGIENRFPFLGNELTRLAVNLPSRYKLRWVPRLHDRRHPFVVDKWLVRQLAARRLPETLAMREKQGFPVRLQHRLHIRPSFFSGGFVSQRWCLSDAAVEEILERSSPTWQLGLALVEVWGRQFFEGESCDEVAETFARHTELRSHGPPRAGRVTVGVRSR
jgi:asparagine synthase (glutamine-hydrolysing)